MCDHRLETHVRVAQISLHIQLHLQETLIIIDRNLEKVVRFQVWIILSLTCRTLCRKSRSQGFIDSLWIRSKGLARQSTGGYREVQIKSRNANLRTVHCIFPVAVGVSIKHRKLWTILNVPTIFTGIEHSKTQIMAELACYYEHANQTENINTEIRLRLSRSKLTTGLSPSRWTSQTFHTSLWLRSAVVGPIVVRSVAVNS